ncbi:MAG: hypothetical protein V1772_14220, partial [Chloroflexota bacterium]
MLPTTVRRITLILGLACLAWLGLGLAGAAEDPEVVHVSGAIALPITWSADKVYVVDLDVTVNLGIVLTIEPGTVIKFEQNADLIVRGMLRAGTGPVFTRLYLPLVMRPAGAGPVAVHRAGA